MDVDSLIGDSMQVINELNEPMPWYYAEQLRRLTGAVESKLKEVTCRLLEQLAMERAARVVSEREAKAAQTKSQDEIRQLKEGLERAVREAEEFKCHMNHNWFSDFINQLCVFWKKLTSH